MVVKNKNPEKLDVIYESKFYAQLRYFLLYFTAAVAVVSFIVAGLFVNEYFNTIRLINSNESLQLSIVKETLLRDLEEVGPDLRLLTKSEVMQSYVENPNDGNKKNLEDVFITLALYKRIYRQIRFIDNSGHERVRVDFDHAKDKAISSKNLQNKSNRYYFVNSANLKDGDVFMSRLDLNVEHGKLEEPHKPVIRFVTPVFDANGNKSGVIVLNYLADKMLSHFDKMLDASWGDVALLNNDGYWLRSHEKEREWGFMLGSDKRFQNEHQKAWSNIAAKEEGRIKGQDGSLFNFVTINPPDIVRKSADFAFDYSDSVNDNAYVWKIVSKLPKSVVEEIMLQKIIQHSAPMWLLLVSILSVSCWHFAGSKVDRRRAQLSNELHAKVFFWSTDGVMVTDVNGKIIDVNKGFENLTEYMHDEVIGSNTRILASGRHDAVFHKNMWDDLIKNGVWEGEVYNRKKSGEIVCNWQRIAAVLDEKGMTVNYVSVFSDITKQKASEKELLRKARQDSLTKLANRAAFDEFINHEIARAQRAKTKIACLYIDLNKFKEINDTHGHGAGDAVLEEIAKRLDSTTRETDKAARLGGDEFAIALIDIGERENVDLVKKRICKALEPEIKIKWGRFSIDASFGAAMYPDDADNRQDLIEAADKQMYKGKFEKR